MPYTPGYVLFFETANLVYPKSEHENIVKTIEHALQSLHEIHGPGFATGLDYQPSIVLGSLGVNFGRSGGGISRAFVGDIGDIREVHQDAAALIGPGNADGAVTISTLNYFFLKRDGTFHINTTGTNPGSGALLAGTGTFNTVEATAVDGNPVGRKNIDTVFPGKSRVVVGAEAANVINVSSFAVNANGRDLAEAVLMRAWLSDTVGGNVSATAPDGGIAISGGIGAILQSVVANKDLVLLTRASDGQVSINITHSAAKTWYINIERGGKITSPAVVFT